MRSHNAYLQSGYENKPYHLLPAPHACTLKILSVQPESSTGEDLPSRLKLFFEVYVCYYSANTFFLLLPSKEIRAGEQEHQEKEGYCWSVKTTKTE